MTACAAPSRRRPQLWRRLVAWRDGRRYGPLTRDWCETCGRTLRVREVVEVWDRSQLDDDFFRPGEQTAVCATYCPEHAPEEATR